MDRMNLTTNEENKLNHVIDRQKDMDMWRKSNEEQRRKIDEIFKRKTRVKYNGIIDPNFSWEKILIETYIWTLPAGIPIKVQSDWRVDWILLELAKYTLEHYIEKERIIKILKTQIDYEKAKYWTAMVYSGLWNSVKFYGKKDKNGKTKPEKVSINHIWIKNISIYDVWFDETAREYEDAMDCIYQEVIREEEYNARYKDNKKELTQYKHLDEVVATSVLDEKDWKTNNADMVTLWHYFNIFTGEYIIVANKKIPIYCWYFTNKHASLPIVPIQHYRDTSSLYGEGIPKRFSVCKWLIKNFLESMVGGARIASWTTIFSGEGQAIDDIYIEPWEVTVSQMTEWSARDIVPFTPQVNVGQMVQILQILDDYGIQMTGLNLKAPYSTPSQTAFEAGIMKEEQNNRLKTPAELRNIGLDQIFTLMLSNIFQFAPTVETEKIFNEKQELVDKTKLEIPIKDKVIKREDDKEDWKILSFEERLWGEDYFNLDDKLFNWADMLKVQVATPSTPNILKSLEKAEMQEYINAKMNLANIAQDPSIINVAELNKKLDMIYDQDSSNLIIKSQEDAIRERTAEQMKAVNEIVSNLDSNPQENENPNQPDPQMQEMVLPSIQKWSSPQSWGFPTAEEIIGQENTVWGAS